ncbi:MAG: M23 family metallopeptidase [Cyclobacteriaceae bacterium]|nr:M23 family metallopeptidase [Cyclobacteriaceae bacterium]
MSNIAGFLGVSLMIALGITYAYHSYFTPVKETRLLVENHDIKAQWDLLDHNITSLTDEIKQLEIRDDNIYRTILDVEPIASTVRQAGVGGSDPFQDINTSDTRESEMVLNTYKVLDKLKKQMYIQTRSYDDLEKILDEKQRMWNSKPAIYPLNYKDIRRTGSGFGWRSHPIFKRLKFHSGLDISAAHGKPIYATGDGIITTTRYSKSYGNVVYIDHDFGYETRYAHMSAFTVKEGQTVKRGDVIGYIGSTGWSTSPHVHYELVHNGKHIDPVPYLNKNLSEEELEKIIEASNEHDLVMDY